VLAPFQSQYKWTDALVFVPSVSPNLSLCVELFALLDSFFLSFPPPFYCIGPLSVCPSLHSMQQTHLTGSKVGWRSCSAGKQTGKKEREKEEEGTSRPSKDAPLAAAHTKEGLGVEPQVAADLGGGACKEGGDPNVVHLEVSCPTEVVLGPEEHRLVAGHSEGHGGFAPCLDDQSPVSGVDVVQDTVQVDLHVVGGLVGRVEGGVDRGVPLEGEFGGSDDGLGHVACISLTSREERDVQEVVAGELDQVQVSRCC